MHEANLHSVAIIPGLVAIAMGTSLVLYLCRQAIKVLSLPRLHPFCVVLLSNSILAAYGHACSYIQENGAKSDEEGSRN